MSEVCILHQCNVSIAAWLNSPEDGEMHTQAIQNTKYCFINSHTQKKTAGLKMNPTLTPSPLGHYGKEHPLG